MQSKANINTKVLLINRLHHYTQEFERVSLFYNEQVSACMLNLHSITDYSAIPRVAGLVLPEAAQAALDIEVQKYILGSLSLVQFEFKRKSQKFQLKAAQLRDMLEQVLQSADCDCNAFARAIDETEILSDFDLAGTNFVPFK